jgi:hypothetical protein
MGLLSLVLILGVFEAVAPSVQAISVEGMPTWEAQLVSILQLVFNTVPPAVLAGFGWTLFGFLRYKAGDDEVSYDLTKMAQTFTWFITIITPMTYGLSQVGQGIPLSTAITTVIMAFKSVLNQLSTATQQPAGTPPLGTGTSPTPTPPPAQTMLYDIELTYLEGMPPSAVTKTLTGITQQQLDSYKIGLGGVKGLKILKSYPG